MKLEITRQRNEANEVSISIDIIINEQKYQLSGYINFQDYDGEIYISEIGVTNKHEEELYEWCLRHGHDYNELKDYIINNIELPKNDSHDHESNSLSPDRPYIRYKTSVLEQMLEECNETYEMYKISKELELREYKGEIYNTKPYHLRKDIGSPNTRN
tara:strand:- start:546 stop:1019 length:474 start_codon:yes stop_codon:yes gene_type:complete